MKRFKKFALAGAVAASLFFAFALLFKHSAVTDPPSGAARNNSPAAVKTGEPFVAREKLAEAYGKLPLHFEPNLGQTDERVRFTARGHGYALFLTESEAVLALQKRGETERTDKQSLVRMRLAGANPAAASGLAETTGKSNYFIGSDASKWKTNVPNFSKVRYEKVYDGIDLIYYGNNQRLEYDFVVQPGADPQRIKLNFGGVKAAKIDESSGDLLLETEVGTLRQHAPVVYQNIDGARREVAAAYAVQSSRSSAENSDGETFTVSFNLADYDRSKELVIDPILAYGSYLGGSLFDQGGGIAVDAEGNAYIVGTAASRDFPTTAASLKPVMLPSTSGSQFWYDAFVTKINPTGTDVVFSTFFGGRNGNESGGSIEVDAGGNIIFSGTTMASDLPTVSAYQTTFGGTDDAFAAKLNPTGSALIFSTYLGGNNTDLGSRIALDRATGDAVFTGSTSSPNFPTTAGAFKQKLCETPVSCSGIFYSGSFLVKLSANGSAQYATLFDAGIADVMLDAANNTVIGGTAAANFPTTAGAFQTASSGGVEGLIAKMNPAGSGVVFATFLGGGLQSDRVKGIALDSAGNIYATGQTQNAGFPVTPGAFDQTFNGGEDGFVTKLNAAGSALVYSTFFGGTGRDEPFAIGLGTDESVFVAGETLSPTTFPLKNSINGTSGTIFLTRFMPDGAALVFSTLLGQGGAYDLAVDAANNAFLTGHTTNVPVTPDAFQTIRGGGDVTSSTKDAFVMKLAPTDETAPHYSISGTVTDMNFGYNNDYSPIVVTVTGPVSRSYNLPYSSNGVSQFSFGNLPAGGTYTLTVRKTGYVAEPESVTFPNFNANQFADFTLLRNQPPEGVVTSPAHGTTFNAPASISIAATASDSDNDTIQKVDFVAYSSATGVVPLGTDTTAPYEFEWTNVPVGTWSLSAIPTDSKGLRGYSTPVVYVTVVDPTGANVSLISPTDGQTFTQGGYVPIAVSVSSSVNLVEVRDQNNNLVGRMTGGPWTTQWRVMDVGSYTLTAKAFTQTGQTATSAPVNLTVAPINHRISGRIYDSITNSGVGGIVLNLTSPTDPDIAAQAVTDSSGNYLFSDLGTTPDDGVRITPAATGYAFAPEFRNIAYLGYIEWTNQNFVATRQTQISLALTSPTSGQVFTAPATINLAANATSGAGQVTQVEFLRRNPNGSTVVLATDTTAPFEHQLTGVGAGNYTYLARAADSTGAVAQSAAVGVTVNVPTVSLSGRVTNQAGEGVQGVEVYVGGGYAWSVPTDANGNFAFTNLPGARDYYITPQPANTITFTPVSRSYTNVTSNITGIDFVASPPNQSPTLQFVSPADGAVYTLPDPVPLNVVANDPDNNVVSLRVIANNGSNAPTIAQTSGSSINILWRPSVPGSYTLTAIVRDGGPVDITTQISITVNPPPPVSFSGRIVDRNSVGIEGATVDLKRYSTNEDVATVTTDANGNYTIPNVPTFVSYILRVSKQDYTFAPRERIYFNVSTAQAGDFTGTLQVQPSEFDGDGATDLAVWRPATGDWHVLRSGDNTYTGLRFGAASFGDIAVPGNFDGDRKTDYAVFRPSNGTWYIRQSSNAEVRAVQFGAADDKPSPGDFDGDGKTDLAVFRPSSGYWYILRSSDGGLTAVQWGASGDLAVAGDYDGDGLADIGVFRPASGTWYVRQSTNGSLKAFQFGADGDAPAVGDFDGDKRTDFTVFRPSSGTWYVWQSAAENLKAFQWGASGDRPVAGDYDRDGKTDFAVFRPGDGNWYIWKSASGTYTVEHFGTDGDVPVPAAYVR